MPFALSDLQNIDAQIASGVTTIVENGKTLTFSGADLQRRRELIIADLKRQGILPQTPRVTLVESGPEYGGFWDRGCCGPWGGW